MTFYESLCDEILHSILESPVIHIDETTVRLRKQKGYVWVMTTMDKVYYFYNLNPAHSTSRMSLNRPIDGLYKRFWYPEPYLTFGEVRLRCVGHHEIYESPVIIGV
jgi:hypothetical protein